MLRVSLRNLLVRAALRVVPLELAMSSIFWFVFSGWSSLNESRLLIFHWDPKSIGETKRVYHLIIYNFVKLDVESFSELGLRLELRARTDVNRKSSKYK